MKEAMYDLAAYESNVSINEAIKGERDG